MKSHWQTYKTYLTQDDKNVLAAVERVVGTIADFAERVTNAVVDNSLRLAAVQAAPALHPCQGGVGIRNGVQMWLDPANNCEPLGRINFFPYAPQP